MKTLIAILSILLMTASCFAQTVELKKTITESEITFLQMSFDQIAKSDQEYRSPISNNTLDSELNHKIDSVFNTAGIEAGIAYKKSLNLKLPKSVKDSLWDLQHEIDYKNHLILRGVFATYGWIPESIVKENNFVQILLLMHPPKDWNPETYRDTYFAFLKKEVAAGRMPAETCAKFYDNITGKILKRPQLYGTNMQFDIKTNKVLPPGIISLDQTNQARINLGLPELKDGEYRIVAED